MISIIIPCYNVAGFIGQALDSLLNQEEQINIDYEIICIDDCSRDTTLDELQRYSERGVRVIPLDVNKGVSHARNLGLAKAEGQYIWFFDADDLADPDSLSVIIRQIRDNGGVEAIRFYASYVGEDSHNGDIKLLDTPPTANNLYCYVLSKAFLTDKGLYFCEEMTYGEDVSFLSMCFVYGIRIESLDRTLYYYRQRSTSLMHSISEERYFQSMLKLPYYYSSYRDHIPEASKAVRERLDNLIYDGVHASLMHAVRKNRTILSDTVNYLKDAKLYPYPIRWRSVMLSNGISAAFSKALLLFIPYSRYLFLLNRLFGSR